MARREAGCRSRGVEFAPDSPLEGDILVRIEQDVRLFPSIAIGNGGSAMTGDDLPNLPFYGRTVASFLKYAMRCTWVCPWTLAGWCRMKMGL